ncbi:MAG: hypothetical protein IT382_01955 [Deltaproteobacteria bacterium]|nr:hypothetical protein [Deltaproteobacteria bacterium]
MPSIRSLTLVPSLLSAALLIAGTGCGQRLTPERVRELLDAPTGDVSPDSMGRVTRDLFGADRATGAEALAQLIKADQGDGSSNAVRPIPGVQTGVIEDAGDVFCVGGLVAGLATFDGCELGEECDADVTIDSCLLRVGDEGDEAARGKIRFQLTNVVEAELERSTMSIEFQEWKASHDEDTLDTLDGVIALESSRATDDSAIDLVFAADFDQNLVLKEHGLFEDGIQERTETVAGLRFQASETEDSAQGQLDVLAFVDENGNREESVTIRLAAESHRVDADNATASAALEVIAANGTFACTWSGAEEAVDNDGVHVTSAGSCVDEDGETFDFSAEATSYD